MGMIDVADAVRADFAALSVPVVVYYGPQFVAQDDAASRVVFVPTVDAYSFNYLPTGQNPRALRTRECHATINIWAVGAKQNDPNDQGAADYRALDALINQVIQSVEHAITGNYELGQGRNNNTTPHAQYGRMYELDLMVYVPITEIAWAEATGVVAAITTEVVKAEAE